MAKTTNEILTRKSILGERKKKTKKEPNLIQIPLPKGARKSKKRVGQGPGSGIGKTSTRGQKGQWARASSLRRGFEGGQLPLHRRLPKRGFISKNHKEYQPVNLIALEKSNLSGKIGPEELEKARLIQSKDRLIKILGTGEITKAIEITADAFSDSAKEKIEKSGGKAILREMQDSKPGSKESK